MRLPWPQSHSNTTLNSSATIAISLYPSTSFRISQHFTPRHFHNTGIEWLRCISCSEANVGYCRERCREASARGPHQVPDSIPSLSQLRGSGWLEAECGEVEKLFNTGISHLVLRLLLATPPPLIPLWGSHSHLTTILHHHSTLSHHIATISDATHDHFEAPLVHPHRSGFIEAYRRRRGWGPR